MSFILDALRKSEIERQRQSGPSIAEIPVAREDRRLPVALVAIGVLLAVNVGVLLFFLLRDGASSEPAAAPPAAAASAPATNAPLVASAPEPAAPTPAIPQAMDPSASGAPAGGGEPQTFYPSQAYDEPTTAPEAPDPTLLPDAPAMMAPGSVAYGNEPPQPPPSLPTDPGAGLPTLTIDLHIFTDDAAKRTVFINGRRYTQGATLAEGPRLEEITQDGAVLNYRGRRFLLPRQ